MASAFTPSQISEYLKHISLPSRYQASSNPPLNYAFLHALHTHHITACPYENLTLHYSAHHTISIEPQQVYQKIVTNKRGRGGYCMENSIFFNHILRGLGFDVYTAPAKIRPRLHGVPQGDFIGWTHMVNIVTLRTRDPETGKKQKQKFALDVAFGGDGPVRPMPLEHGKVMLNLGTQEIRYIKDWIPAQTRHLRHQQASSGDDTDEEDIQTSESSKLWIYQYRNNTDKPWNSLYAFPEFEFSENDYSLMNWFTSASPQSFQTFTVIIVKFLSRPKKTPSIAGIVGPEPSDQNPLGDQQVENEVYGKIMLVNNEIKLNTSGKTELIKVCRNEEERVAALKEYFGITLTDEELRGIKGRCTEVRGIMVCLT